MPPKVRINREMILNAAVDIVRERGEGALNARAVAARLGSSTQPIFSHFESMEALRQEVIRCANSTYQIYLHQEMNSGKYPPYKASGMGYIRFAREEKELFKLLFMRDRSEEEIPEWSEELEPLIDMICSNTGMSIEAARRFHLEMWVFVHGIATMAATNYLPLTQGDISAYVSDMYLALKDKFTAKEQEP